MKRALITGATGFVGTNVARRLLKDGNEVHLLVRRGYAAWRIEEIQNHVHIHEVDLTDPEAVAVAVGRIRPDWVFHLAANGAYSWETDLRQMIQVNLVGTVNLVEACLRVGFEAFVNSGSSSEYGFKDHGPSETEWLEPNSHYAVTKASATLYCCYTARARGVHLPTLRLYSVYGPYEDFRRLVPALVLNGLRGHLPPFANPNVARDYVYVDDVVDAYLLAASRPTSDLGPVYNIGTGTQTPLREVVEIARGLMGISTEPAWGSMPERIWDADVWVSDNRRARCELDWCPQHTLEQGIAQMMSWIRANPAIRDLHYERHARPTHRG